MAVAPDPRKLLIPDETAIPSFLSDKWAPMAGALVGFTSIVIYRTALRRPIFSGIQQHFIHAIGWTVGSKLLFDFNKKTNAERDAVLRHYVELHPEDFPTPERVKVGDVFRQWHPVR